MKRTFLFLLTLGVFSALPATAATKPNVLLICVDDLKPVLHCYGDATAKSPNIDALAARGVLFESAYCNQAVCSPSRNTLMTGLRPQTLGIYDLPTHFRLPRRRQ
jgi:iduronate 2-sulfatase